MKHQNNHSNSISRETYDRLKYGIYARYSSNNQNDKSSADQIRECREYVETKGAIVYDTYKDDAKTAKNDRRDDYARLLDDIRERKFDVLIAESLSRLCRNQGDQYQLRKLLKFHGIELVTLLEGENIPDIVMTLKGYMNEQYLEDCRDLTKRGQRGRVEEGAFIGRPPFGYELLKELDPITGERVKGVLARNEANLSLVQRMFEMYSDGFSPQSIAKAFNEENIKARDAENWSPGTIRQILKNPIYIGQIVWNRHSVYEDPEDKRKVLRKNPEEDWTITQNEELRAVSDNLWLKVKSRREELNREWHERCPNNPLTGKKQNKYMLSGLIKCGECGGNYAMTSKDRYSCSAHKNHKGCTNGRTVVRQILENRVVELLRHKLIDKGKIDRLIESHAVALEDIRSEADSRNKYKWQRIKTLESEIDSIMAAVMRGVVTDTTKSYLQERENEKAELESSLEEHPTIKLPDEQIIEDFIGILDDFIGNLTNEELYRKAMNYVRPLVSKIVMHPEVDGSRAEVHGNIAKLLDLQTDTDGAVSFKVESDNGHKPYAYSSISESVIMMVRIPMWAREKNDFS